MTSKASLPAGPKYPCRSKFGLDKTLSVNTFFLFLLDDIYELIRLWNEGVDDSLVDEKNIEKKRAFRTGMVSIY